MIEKGEVVGNGSPAEIAQDYRNLFASNSVVAKKSSKSKINEDGSVENDLIKACVGMKQTKEKLTFSISVQEKKKTTDDPIVAFGIIRDTGEQVYRWASDENIREKIKLDPFDVEVELDNIFPEAKFSVLLVVKSRDRTEDFGVFNDIMSFEVVPRSSYTWDTYWKPRESYTLNGRKKDVHV
jgi:ABC-2 type transport system ATP-binding protein